MFTYNKDEFSKVLNLAKLIVATMFENNFVNNMNLYKLT